MSNKEIAFKKLKSIIEKSGLFDKIFYLRIYPDTRRANDTPLDHFIKIGLNEDRKPNKHFDPVWYRDFYPDVKADGAYPFIHYLIFGIKESRFINKTEYNEYMQLKDKFDSVSYQNKYDDLKEQNDDFDFLLHYVRYGKLEGREPFYIETVEDNIERNTIEISEDFEFIQNSGYFDETYYLENNPDVVENNIKALEHFILYGWKEGRSPSHLFDVNFYLSNYEDVASSNINPLVHYLKYGKMEGRIASKFTNYEEYIKSGQLLNMVQDKDEQLLNVLDENKPIDILIPVYNGFEFLEPLFKSIFANTSLSYRLLICDDCSPDERVWSLLNEIKKIHVGIEILLLQNEINLGFVGTVNRLVEYTNNHFVLLNTDTEVPSFWLERLMYPILKMDNIATTTPFTNAGTICSFPNYLEDNATIMNNMSVDEIDAYFKKVNFEATYIEIPTGVGFCMGVNKELVNKIGMFDEIFGKGYGEENDFCQRAILEGYKNIHVTDLFVYHKHGGSFPSETKKRLIEKNVQILNKKHPTYNQQVQKTISDNKLENLRNLLYFKIVSSQQHTVLYIDHDLGGGAVDYRNMEITKRELNDELIVLLTFDFKGLKEYIVEVFYKETKLQYRSKSVEELFKTFLLFDFNEIFLNSIVSYPNLGLFVDELIKLQSNNTLALNVPIHDYFSLCPNYTLLNNNNEYCGVPSDHNICYNCLSYSKTAEYKVFSEENDINRWRDMWRHVYDNATYILCFSNSSKDIFKKAYPQYSEKIQVIPHDISGRYENIYEKSQGAEIRIGVLGGINIPKGANVIRDLVEHIDKNNINAKVILIGEISIEIDSPSFEKTGRYERENLPSIVKNLNITKFFIPSICPETYSYTTDEIMQMGYPLSVFDIGAPAERVRHYEYGEILAINDFKKLLRIK